MGLPLRLFPEKPNLNFLRFRFFGYTLSILITILTAVLFFSEGFNLGIDFSGGIVLEVRTESKHTIEDFRTQLSEYGYGGAVIQNFGQDSIMIRIPPHSSTEHSEEVKNIQALLQTHIDPAIEFRKVDYVGPKVGSELIANSFKAMFFALIAMLAYIWFRFDWQFGIGAVIALVHDALATLGFFLFTQYDFDLSSVAAIMLVIGYSINDTVVIYDRIRENLRKYKNKTLIEILNTSINETLSRTIMTVATTLLACLSLALLGGEVLEGFSMALLFGIAFGTYSSIFVSVPLLLLTGLKTSKAA